MGRRVRRGFDRELFREAVKAAGLPPADLARLADISPATIHSWERRGGSPDVERLARIAAVLGVDITAFVHVSDDECFPADLRVRKGLTQVQLAAAAGLSTTVVSGFERTPDVLYIKTDGIIHDGSSGGAAINSYSELVGIPTMVVGNGSGQIGYITSVDSIPAEWFRIFKRNP